MKEKKYKEALNEFKDASKVLPNNKEITFYKSSAMLMLFLHNSRKKLNLGIDKEYFYAILKEYDAAIKTHKFDHFLCFYRGLVHLYIKNFDKAINDFSKAIKNNDIAYSKYHMYMGLAYGCANVLSEAMKQFTIAIELNEDYLLAYYNRGKCAYLQGDVDQAFADFQKLPLIRPVIFFK